jgi:hypothetical protein
VESCLSEWSGKVDGPAVEIEVLDIEAGELPGTEAGIVGERDDRLVAVLQIGRTGVGEALVAELFDLVGFEPSSCLAFVALGSVNVRIRGVGVWWGHGFLSVCGNRELNVRVYGKLGRSSERVTTIEDYPLEVQSDGRVTLSHSS